MNKLGELKIIAGEYTGKDGRQKKRYVSVGAVFGTPHHSRLSIKLYATAFSDEKWANVFFDEGCEPNPQSQQVEATSGDRVFTPEAQPASFGPDEPIDLMEIPF
jgi:hypothetical protein